MKSCSFADALTQFITIYQFGSVKLIKCYLATKYLPLIDRFILSDSTSLFW